MPVSQRHGRLCRLTIRRDIYTKVMKSISSIASRFGLLFFLAVLVSCDHQDAIQAQPPSRSSEPQRVATEPDSATGEIRDTARTLIPMVEGDFSWPRLLGNQFDGVADSQGIEFDWSRSPEVVWQLPVGTGYGLGSIAAGRYYHLDAIRKDLQQVDLQQVERLRAFDLKDAKLIWSVERPQLYNDMYGYESGPRGTPAISGESIVTYGVEGGLYCRKIADGSLNWSVATNEKYGVVQNFFGVSASPLIVDSMVIVPVGGSPPEDQAIAPGRLDRVIPNGSALVAFDLATGKEIWRCGDDLASYSSPRTMQIGSTTIVLLLARDHLLAVDATNGNVLWKKHHRSDMLESVNAMIPVVNNDRVFISECYQIGSLMMKVSVDSAETIWQDPPENRRKQAMRCHWSTPILVDGFLYGCSGRNKPDSDFRCIEFESGKVQWSDNRRIRTSLARAGEYLVVLDERGRMQIIRPSPEKLDVVAEHDFSDILSEPCWAAPIIVGNRMLIRGNRNVLCLALPTK